MTHDAPAPACDLVAAESWLAASAPLDVSVAVGSVAERQRGDGSWGSADDVWRRVLPTLWTTAVLAELGATRDPATVAATTFLSAHAATQDGVFSRDGRRDGVLACYVAIAATTYALCGRPDLAQPQIEWIMQYQDVRERGVSLRGGVERYHPGLAHRYGGCLASTTCLIGVVKAGRALEVWRRTAPDPVPLVDGRDVDELLAVMREALLVRRLMLRSDGRTLALGTPPARAEEWLQPSFPLDWRTDLVEVLDLVARTGPADERMQPALERLAALQRPDGGWPLLRSFWPAGFPSVEPRSSRRSSRLVTSRVVAALTHIRPADDGSPARRS